jgi:hypothetical protein
MALVVSIGSLAIAIWATRISKTSLDHAVSVQQESDKREFERSRADLLNQVSDSRAILDKTRIEIGTLRADFQVEPQTVQAAMANYTTLFSDYLPKIEETIRQCDQLWESISAWGADKGYADLMQARAALYRSLKDDELAKESGIYLVGTFRTKLESARKKAGY